MEIGEVFGHFLQKFLIWDHETFLQAYCEYFQVCVKNGPCVPNFRVLFDPNR